MPKSPEPAAVGAGRSADTVSRRESAVATSRHHYTLMKHTITFILLGLLLTGCGRRDAKIQQELTGTWSVDINLKGRQLHSTLIVSPDGSCADEVAGFEDGKIMKTEGSLIATNGALIDIVTKNSWPDSKVPSDILRGRIVSLDDYELIVRWEGMDKDTILKRIKP